MIVYLVYHNFLRWRVRIIHTRAHVGAVGAGTLDGNDVADFWLLHGARLELFRVAFGGSKYIARLTAVASHDILSDGAWFIVHWHGNERVLSAVHGGT